MKRNEHFILLILFIFLTGISFAQDRFGEKSKEIDHLMNLCHKYRMFTGSVLVGKQGNIIYHKAFGMANRSWNITNRCDTKYKIGSLTKQFTALLVLQLVQAGDEPGQVGRLGIHSRTVHREPEPVHPRVVQAEGAGQHGR